MLRLAQSPGLADWVVHMDRMAPTADFVAEVIRSRYPGLDIPLHARWRHFVIGGRDLWAESARAAEWQNVESAARSAFDLAITSVLLDAGAGAGWRYQDGATGMVASRSEGLALASLRWFESGALSDHAGQPRRVDAAALRRLDARSVELAFQAGDMNPLQGLQGRATLMNRLGLAVASRPDLFGLEDSLRPGGLFDALRARAEGRPLRAGTLLETVLEAFGPIWVDRPQLAGVPLGDCWPHPALVGDRPEDGYAPLHKLSQWLSYSLIEPLEHAGTVVCNLDELTGLAEYRNGGLFIDMGVLEARDSVALSMTHAVGDPFVVGWRALTVALLDRLAPMVGARLGVATTEFPLARMLEGGTWAAGRLLARRMRADGGPPFHVSSDGTVF
jgi:hypothetical protein